jgi:hypothetical protein
MNSAIVFGLSGSWDFKIIEDGISCGAGTCALDGEESRETTRAWQGADNTLI